MALIIYPLDSTDTEPLGRVKLLGSKALVRVLEHSCIKHAKYFWIYQITNLKAIDHFMSQSVSQLMIWHVDFVKQWEWSKLFVFPYFFRVSYFLAFAAKKLKIKFNRHS